MERVVDDHHLAVVARADRQRSGHRDAGLEQPHLELAQILLSAAIGMGDQRADDNTSGNRSLERLLELRAIEAEDDDVDRLLRAFDACTSGARPVFGLDDEFHSVLLCLVLFFRPVHRRVALGIETENGVR